MSDLQDERRRYSSRPTVVTPEMHYGLSRRVDSLENRVSGTELAVHEISQSNDSIRGNIDGWFRLVGDNINALLETERTNRLIICLFGVLHFITMLVIIHIASR